MRHWLIFVFAVVGWLAGGGAAAARQDLPPSPNPTIFKCGGCPYRDDKQREIDGELKTLRDRLDNIRSNQQALGKSIARHAADIARHTADAAAGKPGAADAAGQAGTRLGDAAGQLRNLNEAFRRTVREESENELEKIKLRQEQDACRQECPEVHSSNTTSTAPPTLNQTATLPAACSDCPKLAADLVKKRDELNELQEAMTTRLLKHAAEVLEYRARLREAVSKLPAKAADAFVEKESQYEVDTTDIENEIRQKSAEVEAARKAVEDCDDKCSSPTTPISRTFSRPLMYAAGGGAIVVGALVVGGSPPVTMAAQTPNATPNAPVTQTPAAPAPAPAPTTPSCTEFSGTYSFAGTLRLPRSCFFTGTVPYFQSSIAGSFVLQLDASCSGTLTTRHPNSWTFMHRVTGGLSGSTLQLRSSGSFSSTQPFGTPFSSTVELTKANNTYSGTETHISGSCTDVYDLRDNR